MEFFTLNAVSGKLSFIDLIWYLNLIPMFDFSSLSSYIEFFAATILAYAGLKNFREEVLNFFINKEVDETAAKIKEKLLSPNFGFTEENLASPAFRGSLFKDAVKFLSYYHETRRLVLNKIKNVKIFFISGLFYCLVFIMVLSTKPLLSLELHLKARFTNFEDLACFLLFPFANMALLNIFMVFKASSDSFLYKTKSYFASVFFMFLACIFFHKMAPSFYSNNWVKLYIYLCSYLIPVWPFIVHFCWEYYLKYLDTHSSHLKMAIRRFQKVQENMQEYISGKSTGNEELNDLFEYEFGSPIPPTE